MYINKGLVLVTQVELSKEASGMSKRDQRTQYSCSS